MTSMTSTYRLPLKKRILNYPIVQETFACILSLLMRLCWLTYRVETEVRDGAMPFFKGEQQGIFCFWHGRMIVFPFFKPKSIPMHVLISHHRDGEMIARIISYFGINCVRGSSNKGAMEATRKLLQLLKNGDSVAITPDGPRGPIFKAQNGAAILAKMSTKPLVPVTFSASKPHRLRSWDRFMIPLPFSKVVVQVGAPIEVDKKADKETIEQARQTLEATMFEMTTTLDEQIIQERA